MRQIRITMLMITGVVEHEMVFHMSVTMIVTRENSVTVNNK